ncbi:4-amino-4-deoxy-L-arabinose-phospho-UDP flippase [Mangrovibacter sp. MFB070]|uniref:4-amino-4-deoxy-L-arabinose-phosphoundecaprenol flippase subunit ArnF n=1 Tax=Mangrovibacter sp. MFB070 TaxID=1224318 RepID=UPI0004D3A28A|nr:4-amino-4-deoxy-L-arabinose-phosphoundecaprenol flippase subunit ArnF [Mangrovibacter sp. MFB070]KEA50754.1 4-amino-4-deoxy-L-arabinose-phospho-UDP flippase [Mangrovibacter sp. MFB070]
MGYLLALCSVLLVTAAQLAMKLAMGRLPAVWPLPDFLLAMLHIAPGTLWLVAGVGGYLASMVCWYGALKKLPLSKAYSLLSLSYILVWAAAIWLPGWHDTFSWLNLLGVLSIMAGVTLVIWPGKNTVQRQQ